MDESALRTVLLVRSIDEGDKTGQVLSLEERAEATLAAAKGAPLIASGLTGPVLPAAAEHILLKRAELLLAKLQSRAPVVDRVLELAAGVSWLGPALLTLAFISGVSLSAFDGSQRIEILATPVWGLLLWNFAVYVTLFVLWVRALRRHKESLPRLSSRVSGFFSRVLRGRVQSVLRDTARFNVPLTEVMQQFSSEWVSIVRPTWQLRAARLLHLGSIVLAFGCVAGMYVRGLVLRYDAGWDSTFLEVPGVRLLMGILYGPASALTGIGLPDEAGVQALRWTDPPAEVPAAPFIHLIAVTLLIYIGLPRLLLLLSTNYQLWQARRRLQLPAAFIPYARKILVQTGRVSGLRAHVYSYAYEPSTDSLAGLTALLADAIGGEVKTEQRASIAYGDEDTFAERIAHEPLPQADCYVLLMSLASTPETENHGALINTMKNALAGRGSGLALIVDESPFAARMGNDPALAPRRAERSQSWREFVAKLGETASIVELRQLRPGTELGGGVTREVRAALQRAEQA